MLTFSDAFSKGGTPKEGHNLFQSSCRWVFFGKIFIFSVKPFSVLFEWPIIWKGFLQCKQQTGCFSLVSSVILVTQSFFFWYPLSHPNKIQILFYPICTLEHRAKFKAGYHGRNVFHLHMKGM